VQAKDREVAQAQQEIQESKQRVSLVCVKLCNMCFTELSCRKLS
jgi:hypothetical protein